MEEYKEFSFFRGKVRFRQPREHRLSVVELLFSANLKGIRKKHKVVDLGAGFGALSILTSLKHECSVWAVERDKRMINLLKHNIEINGLRERVHVVELDIRDIKKVFKPGFFDVVIANPPFYNYMQTGNGYHHETDTTLKDFITSGSFLLRDGGSFNILIASERTIEVILYLKERNINASSLRFFYPKTNKNAKIVRIHALKNITPKPIVERPLIINEEGGGYTPEVRTVLESFL
ncbi:MAG: methyltransferase [Aquificaceae bacterium]|nr:methyltransferase [Aquificaceae bacterium]